MTESNPAAPTSVPEPDWAEISRVYESGEPLKNVADKYLLTIQKISAHAKRNGWVPRSARKEKAVYRTNAKSSPRHQSTDALMKRLTGLVERQIAEIETRLAEAGEARDHERDARTLSNLTRTLDKLVELKRGVEEEKEVRRLRQREKKNRKGEGRDEEAIRAELARRLARIAAANTAP